MFGIDRAYTDIIQKAWGKGFVNVSEFNHQTAAYCSKYIIKQLQGPQNSKQQVHEYSRMSNRPGIGADAMAVIGETLHSTPGLNAIEKNRDVPHQIRINGKLLPLGSYLRKRLRKEIGMPEEWIEDAKTKALMEKGLEVLEVWKNQTDNLSFGAAMVASWQGQIWSVESRQKLIDAKKGQKL